MPFRISFSKSLTDFIWTYFFSALVWILSVHICQAAPQTAQPLSQPPSNPSQRHPTHSSDKKRWIQHIQLELKTLQAERIELQKQKMAPSVALSLGGSAVILGVSGVVLAPLFERTQPRDSTGLILRIASSIVILLGTGTMVVGGYLVHPLNKKRESLLKDIQELKERTKNLERTPSIRPLSTQTLRRSRTRCILIKCSSSSC